MPYGGNDIYTGCGFSAVRSAMTTLITDIPYMAKSKALLEMGAIKSPLLLTPLG